MRKHQLALLMVLPLILLAMSAYIRWAEHRLLNPQIEKREGIRKLKELALHPDKELNPQARVKQLSEILINVDAAFDGMVQGILQTYRGLVGILEGLALLQIGLSIYLFWKLKTPNRGVQPTPTSGRG